MTSNANSFTILGASTDDQGPRGTIARFITAAMTEDEAAAAKEVTIASRDGLQLGGFSDGEVTAEIGEATQEGEIHLVPTKLTGVHGPPEMPFVVVQEEGAYRIDFEATMQRVFGMDPMELMQGLGDAMAEGMQNIGNAIADGFKSLSDDAESTKRD